MKLSLVSLVRFSQLIPTLPTRSKANAGNDSKANPSLPTNTAVKINVHTGRIPPTAGTTREASNFCNPEKNATRPKMYKNPASSPNTIYRGSGISRAPRFCLQLSHHHFFPVQRFYHACLPRVKNWRKRVFQITPELMKPYLAIHGCAYHISNLRGPHPKRQLTAV